MLQHGAQPGGHRSSRSPRCVMASKQFFTFGISAMMLVVALLMDSAMAGENRRINHLWTNFWS